MDGWWNWEGGMDDWWFGVVGCFGWFGQDVQLEGMIE